MLSFDYFKLRFRRFYHLLNVNVSDLQAILIILAWTQYYWKFRNHVYNKCVKRNSI